MGRKRGERIGSGRDKGMEEDREKRRGTKGETDGGLKELLLIYYRFNLILQCVHKTYHLQPTD